MSKKPTHIIFLTLGVMIVVGYLIFALKFLKINDDEIKCTDLIVSINGNSSLISEDEVHEMLSKQNIHPIGESLNNLKTNQIEDFILENPYVTKASSYFTPQGLVYLTINLREPKFIVASDENYYVDKERTIIPIPLYANTYLPIVTGCVTQDMATNEVFDFISLLEKNEFWNAQISQIYIKENLQVELSPRVGDTKILISNLHQSEEKLQQVYRFYQQGFSKIGWNRYKLLDLRYDNQIIGIRN